MKSRKLYSPKHEDKLAGQIEDFLNCDCPDHKATWAQIRAYITNDCHWIVRSGGWVEVRGALQVLLNEGLVKRTKDIRVEEYISAS